MQKENMLKCMRKELRNALPIDTQEGGLGTVLFSCTRKSNAMKVSCPYCGRLHERGVVCSMKPARKYRQDDREAYRVHRSNRWTKLSLYIRERDAFLCVYCLQHDKRINMTGIEVHHIVPIEQDKDRAYDSENLISLCREHHEQAEKGLIDRDTLEALARKQENEGMMV